MSGLIVQIFFPFKMSEQCLNNPVMLRPLMLTLIRKDFVGFFFFRNFQILKLITINSWTER